MLFRCNYKNRNMVVCEINNGAVLDIYDLLADSSVVDRNPNLFLTSDELDLPYLISEDAQLFTEVFELLDTEQEPSDDLIAQIKGALDSTINLSVEEYKGMHKAIRRLHSYFSETKIEINFPIANYENFNQTKELVERVKKTSGSFSISDNKTLFRKNCNDELFIMVPSPDSLVLAEELTSFIPNMKNVFVPFEDEELYTHNYKRALKEHGMGTEEIFGDPNNNKFEIYPEEERYYNALVALHNSLMEREHPNNSLEDCIKFNEYSDLFKTYIGYMIVEVLRYHRNHSGFISLNSYSNDDDSDDDNKDDNVGGEEMSINLFYASTRKGNFDGEEVILSLVEDQIKQDCYAPINILIQALRFGKKLPSKIELFNKRFFDLKEFSYSNLSGSFSSYVVEKTSLGNNYRVVGLVNSNNRILDSDYARSVGFTKTKIDCPVGLILKKSFANSNESQLMLISFVDLVRFIGLDDSLTIDGVSVNNGKVAIDSSIVPDSLLDGAMSLDEVISRLNYPSFIGYVNPVMKGDFIECNAYNNSICSLGILKDVLTTNNLKNLNVFTSVSKDDVLDKARTYRLSPEYILRCTVSYYMLDLVIQADKFITDLSMSSFDYSLTDVISIYQNVVDSSDYPLGVYTVEYGDYIIQKSDSNTSVVSNQVKVSESAPSTINNSSVYDNVTTQNETQPNNPSTESSVEISEGGNMYNLDNLFYKGNVESIVKVVLPTELVNRINSVYKELGNPFQIKSLSVDGETTVVGYLAVVNKNYVFLEPKEYNLPVNKKFTLTKLSSKIMSIIRVVASGGSPAVKFDGIDSLNYYCRILEKC